MINILKYIIANENSVVADKDKRKKKIKELIVKADLTENEQRLLSMLQDREAIVNLDTIKTAHELTGTTTLGRYKLRVDDGKGTIKMAEDSHNMGFRDNALTLAHEVGHAYQYKVEGNENPVFEDMKEYMGDDDHKFRQNGEVMADYIARGLLGILKINPNLKTEGLNVEDSTTPFYSEEDSVDMDNILKKLLKVRNNTDPWGGKVDKQRMLSFKQKHNLE